MYSETFAAHISWLRELKHVMHITVNHMELRPHVIICASFVVASYCFSDVSSGHLKNVVWVIGPQVLDVSWGAFTLAVHL